MDALALTFMASASTTAGGLCAVFFQRRLALLMAFGAGVLVAAACLNLLPAALAAGADAEMPKRFVFEYAALGAFFFYCVHRETDRTATPSEQDQTAGRLSVCLLIVHSILDGTAIFAAFVVSPELGLIVGSGIVAHDLCDGLNTMLFSTSGRRPRWPDYGLLAVDALAPVAGGLLARSLFVISPTAVMIFLSFAVGSFLFTAAFRLIPGAFHGQRRFIVATVAVAGFLSIFYPVRYLSKKAVDIQLPNRPIMKPIVTHPAINHRAFGSGHLKRTGC